MNLKSIFVREKSLSRVGGGGRSMVARGPHQAGDIVAMLDRLEHPDENVTSRSDGKTDL